MQEEPISQAIHVGQVQVGRYNHPIHSEQTRGPFPAHSVHKEDSISSPRSNTRTAVHVGWAKNAHVNQSFHREELHIKLLNETVAGHDFRKKSRLSAGPGSIYVEKVQVGHPSKVRHAPRAQVGPSNYSVHTEETHGQRQSDAIGSHGNQKARHAAVSCIVEQETVEPPSQTACAEQVQVESCGNTTGWNQKRKRTSRTTDGNRKRKNRGLSSSKGGLHLISSKHSATEPEGIRNSDPIQQPAPSPNENQFDPADIDGIIANLCPSSLPRKQVPQARSNELDNIDTALPPVSINHGTSQVEGFPQCYSQYPSEATGGLANQSFNSAHEHEMHQESSNGTHPRDKSGAQVWQNPSLDVMHGQQIQESSSDHSDSEQVQVECRRSKIVGHHNNTSKGFTHSSNEGVYIGGWSYTGTHQPVTPVTACSDPTTSSPLLTATPLRVTTLPSVVTGPPVDRPPPHCQSPETVHFQDEQAVGTGPINRLSKKRRGRGPTKLIEPRREADRPVLTPNNVDTWDVHPPCPKVASTISALLKQWHPGSTYMSASQHTNEVSQGQLILHFHQYHSDTRTTIMDAFLQRYKWAPGREVECLKLFDRKIVRQFTGLLCDEKRRARVDLASSKKVKEALDASRSNRQTNLDDEDAGEELKQRRRDPAAVGHEDDDPLQWKPFPPEWMQPKWWEMLCEYWASEEVLQVSAQKRKNRYTGGGAQHTAGSRSIAMHRQLMIMENGGKPVPDIEVFNKTHKRSGGKGEFVTERAKQTVEGFKRRLEEAGDTELDPHLVWAEEVGGRSRGRYYGLHGIIDKARIDALSKSIPGLLGRKAQQHMFTQDQVQEMINQAMQQLNETWEKRFQSLEQSMNGMASLDVPQNASDSAHEGTYQSARDDGEDHTGD